MRVTFRVRFASTAAGLSVRVSGDCAALGGWSVDSAVALVPSPDDRHQWSASVDVPAPAPSELHYVYAVYEGAHLRMYEARDSHRTVAVGSASSVTADDGDLRESALLKAWLRDEAAVYVPRVGCTGECDVVSVTLVDASDPRRRWPVAVGRSNPTYIPTAARVAIVVDVVVRATGARGRAVISAGEVMSVRRGLGIVRPAVTLHSGGSTDSSNSGSVFSAEVCDVTVSYLVALPMAGLRREDDTLAVLRGTRPRFARFIGHRGSGATGIDPVKNSALTENTLMSFLAAGRVPGAGGVEFDVHLTADGVPVIFHDIHLPVPVSSSLSSSSVAVLPIPINKLKYEDVLRLRPRINPAKLTVIGHQGTPPGGPAADESSGSVSDDDNDTVAAGSSQRRPMSRRRRACKLQHKQQHKQHVGDFWGRSGGLPTLAEMFEHLPESTGFDIEVKYPDTVGIERDVASFERNGYIDTIAGLVLGRSGSARWVFYSSFDVDTCTLLSRKQQRHDVMLLCTGKQKEASVPGTNCVPEARTAIDTAADIGLRGVVTNTAAVLADPSLVQYAHGKGIVLMTYGSHNNDPEKVKEQLAYGLDAIITDYLKRVVV